MIERDTALQIVAWPESRPQLKLHTGLKGPGKETKILASLGGPDGREKASNIIDGLYQALRMVIRDDQTGDGLIREETIRAAMVAIAKAEGEAS